MHVSAARLEDRDIGVPEARQPDIVKAKRVHLEPAHAAPVGSAEYQFAAAWRVAEDSYTQEKERLREKLNNQRQKLLEDRIVQQKQSHRNATERSSQAPPQYTPLLAGPIDCNKLIKWLHNYDRTATRRRPHSWINWHH